MQQEAVLPACHAGLANVLQSGSPITTLLGLNFTPAVIEGLPFQAVLEVPRQQISPPLPLSFGFQQFSLVKSLDVEFKSWVHALANVARRKTL